MRTQEKSGDWDQYKREAKAERIARRRAESGAFESARSIAEQRGMHLVQRSDVHYQLSPGIELAMKQGAWLLNIYPGNQRLYSDKAKSRSPFLTVPSPWTLVDVVRAASGSRDE